MKTKVRESKTKRPVNIHMYKNQEAWNNHAGWIEPTNGRWILYFTKDGSALFYPNRDLGTGAVLGGSIQSGCYLPACWKPVATLDDTLEQISQLDKPETKDT